MKMLIRAIAVMGAVTGAVAAPALAQDAGHDMGQDVGQDAGGLLDAMGCREFLALEAQDQMTVMLAMRAHVNGDPLPDEPLPIGLEAETSADGLGGDSGNASAEGLEVGTAEAGTVEAAAAEGGEAAAGEVTGDDQAAVPSDEAQAPGGEVLLDEEVIEREVEGGQVNADGTERSVTEEPADPKLTAMRTSCEGGPDALATDAMRAAHADYE